MSSETEYKDPLQKGLEDLEKSWMDRADMRTFLISPIHDAAAKGNLPRLIELMNEEPFDINVVDNAKNTALHWASGAGYSDVVKWLIEHKADMELQNLLGDTPLHRAVWRNQLEAVRTLLESGANPTARNAKNKKPIDLVRSADVGALVQNYDTIYNDGLSRPQPMDMAKYIYNEDDDSSETSSEEDRGRTGYIGE